MVRTLLVERGEKIGHGQQRIKVGQQWCFNLNVGDGRKAGRNGHERADSIHRDRFPGGDQMSQRIDDGFLTLSSRKFQNPDVHFVGDVFGMGVPQHVVGNTKLARWEHFFAVLVVGKRAGLANQ
jgi:hypothetical protein